MTATLLDGTKREFRPGSAVCGHGFKTIELTLNDFSDPAFWEWMQEVVICRMVPVQS